MYNASPSPTKHKPTYVQSTGQANSPVRARRGMHPLAAFLLAGILAITGAVFLFILLISAWYGYYQVEGRIVPGVQVGNIQLGGLTVDEAAVLIHDEWNVGRSIVVDNGLQTWSVPADELGVSVDAIQTTLEAFGYGHGLSMVTEMAQMTGAVLDGWQVAPLVILDSQRARLWLEELNNQVSQSPVNANLAWDGQAFVPVPAQLGYAIDVEKALQTLENDPGGVLSNGYWRLDLLPLLPEVNDVSASVAEAERLMNAEVNIKVYDPISDEYLDYPVESGAIASMIAILPGENGPVVTLDASLASRYLASHQEVLGGGRFVEAADYGEQFAQAVQNGESLIMIASHPATSYTIRPGDTLLKISWEVGMPFWKILQANPGMDPDNLWVGEEIVIPSKDEMLPLPVVPHKRIVISISNQRLWVYENGELLSKHKISTGIDRSPTQPGVFQVRSHDLEAYASVWDLYMPHFIGIYEAWPGFMNGIHGLPTLSSGRRLWGNILGSPASFGCIIMDLKPAEDLYHWAEQGVVVEIRP